MIVNKWILVQLAFLVLAIIFGGLIAVWQGFAILMGSCLLISAGIFTYFRKKSYEELKEKQANQRYCDAYLYADENGVAFNVANFKYPKDVERELKIKRNNSFTILLGSVAICILSVVFIIIALINVL
ncbi:MAG: hypothetical protein IJ301_00120 [Clostridia bacterium]|nr:hypothetical protein [Clostridia bacterium]